MIPEIILLKGEEDRLLTNHPWIYNNEIYSDDVSAEAGSIVDVLNSKKKFLGRGFYNPHSKIRVRILTREKDEINQDFLKKRILSAWNYRKSLGYNDFCRVVFSEADYLPGLIIDKFQDYFSIQTLSFGMEIRKNEIVEIINEIFDAKGIYERNDATVRVLEGLTEQKGFLSDEFQTEIIVKENGLQFYADLAGGQKTGYYFDQRENHAAIEPYVKNAKVLDAFSYTGGFGIHAAHYGASEVISADISKPALDILQKNAKLNGLEKKIETVEANVFELLRTLNSNGASFDTIILDPPPFCKNRASLDQAFKGYKEINRRAIQLLKKDGFLITCSCSFHMLPEFFIEMLKEAAMNTGKNLQIIESRMQAKDHPVLLGFEESHYLKCIIARVV